MFKAPSNIPQDLLHIQGLISEPVPRTPSVPQVRKAAETSESSSSATTTSSDIDSSDDDSEEADVVENLLLEKKVDEEEVTKEDSPSPSSSESDTSSDSEDSDQEEVPKKAIKEEAFYDEDEEDGGNVSVNQILRTKNELSETKVVMPDITEVDSEEALEKIGEIMSVVGDTVIVKGLASEIEDRASEIALDSESLLVFDDRKVLGYVYETFGPTYQPFYQVKFSSASNIDLEVIKISRTVFHVPRRSNFVFPSQLKKLKGSDASNVYDEEVAADEVEFSDDEAEATYKKQKKRKRDENRSSSVASSRNATPIPSQMYDQELNDQSFLNASPFAEYGPYDMDTKPGPSRPAPLPYDDPYQDNVGISSAYAEQVAKPEPSYHAQRQRDDRQHHQPFQANNRDKEFGRGRGRGRGRGKVNYRHGTDRRNSPTHHSGNNREYQANTLQNHPQYTPSPQTFDQGVNEPIYVNQYSQFSPASAPPTDAPWSHYGTPYNHVNSAPYPPYNPHPPQQQFQQNPNLQPHFNPRFAQFFGLNMNFPPNQSYNTYSPSTPTMGGNGYIENYNHGFNWPQSGSVGEQRTETEQGQGSQK